jgi:membrane protease YdiL (CAAX protease family)
MEFLLVLLYIGVVIYVANQDDLKQRAAPVARPMSVLTWLLYGLVGLTVLFAGSIFFLGTTPEFAASLEAFDEPSVNIDGTAAVVSLGLALIVCVLSSAVITSPQARQTLRRLIGSSGAYRPESSVHTTGVVLALLSFSWAVSLFVLQGGLSGMADDMQSESLTVSSLIFDAVMRLVIAFLGVGLMIRRDLPQTLERLGLRIPTWDDLRWGVGGGIILIAVLMVTASLWEALVSEEQFTQQTEAADQIAMMFNTLPLALLVSVCAAVGEEILFRGAMQPIFGWIPTSVFFALLHIQYTLTPATLIIFIVSVGLGRIRMRQSTSAAIIAHFVYDFIPLVIAILYNNLVGSP